MNLMCTTLQELGENLISYGKANARELRETIMKILSARGYEVKRDVKLVGKSGTEYDIDVLAKYRAPLQTFKVIVKCKPDDEPIDRNDVLELIQAVEDLKVDKGVIAGLSGFTSDALTLAKNHNVDLWDKRKIENYAKELKVRSLDRIAYVTPSITAKAAREIVDKSLFGILSSFKVEEGSVVYYPYYELSLSKKIYEMKGFLFRRAEERMVKTSIYVDPIAKELIRFDLKKGMVKIMKFPSSLDEEEADLFKVLAEGEISLDSLMDLTKYPFEKVDRILNKLIEKDVVSRFERKGRIFYKLKEEAPSLANLSTSSILTSRLTSNRPLGGEVLKVEYDQSDLDNIIGMIWKCDISSKRTILYPYYVCKVIGKGRRSIKAVDMVTKKVDERVSMILTSLYLKLPF